MLLFLSSLLIGIVQRLVCLHLLVSNTFFSLWYIVNLSFEKTHVHSLLHNFDTEISGNLIPFINLAIFACCGILQSIFMLHSSFEFNFNPFGCVMEIHLAFVILVCGEEYGM